MRRTGLVAIIAALLVLLCGCSAVRLSYNQGPNLAYFWLDRYADFPSEQAQPVRAALAEWFAWHRSTQLPEYVPALVALQGLAAGDVTPAQVCSQTQQWRARGERAYEHALPALAEMVRNFTPEQMRHLQRRYASNNEDAERDYLQLDAAERREAALKRTVDRAESLYGPLDEAQRKLLAEALLGSPFDAQVWLAERRARQQDILRALRDWQASRADAATIVAGLRQIGQNTSNSPRPAYRAYSQRLNDANCALAAQLHNAVRPDQRRHAVDKLKGWEEDARALLRP